MINRPITAAESACVRAVFEVSWTLALSARRPRTAPTPADPRNGCEHMYAGRGPDRRVERNSPPSGAIAHVDLPIRPPWTGVSNRYADTKNRPQERAGPVRQGDRARQGNRRQ